ncbi:MAG: galactokinase [Bacteroidales bacterium]|nr:galactokinase [Bacteroidales bacterium]
MDYTISRLIDAFISYYGSSGFQIRAFWAPGRVNLLGEHTDYNGGYVLPFSIQQGTYLLIRPTTDGLWKFRSENIPFYAEISIQEEPEKIGNTWINYPLGVIREFTGRNKMTGGFEFLFFGEIPNGAGLSSSASVEMVTAMALNVLMNAHFTITELAHLCQHAENEFVGMNCGILDQYAVGLGEKNKALFLNCSTLEFEQVPLLPGNYSFMICNTNVRRELAGSKYNARHAECREALKLLSDHKSPENLASISIDMWKSLKRKVEDDKLKRRVDHVINENKRVQDGVVALKQNNIRLFGELMHESHQSLRYDFEVSCRELDIMVNLVMETNDAVGAKMTGAGFGGCVIALVRTDAIETFKKVVGKKYAGETGLNPDFYMAKSGSGLKEIELK